jgi:hypothetical protein
MLGQSTRTREAEPHTAEPVMLAKQALNGVLRRSQLITARDNRARGAISVHVMGQGCLAGLR